MKYSAVIPSKDISSIINCVHHLMHNACHLDEVVIIWDGGYDKLMELERELIAYEDISIQFICNCDLGYDVYGMYNYGAFKAKNKYVLFLNDDMFCPPNFDEFISALPLSGKDVITFDLVEPGYVDVNERNIHLNFGMDWESFDMVSFNEYVKNIVKVNGHYFFETTIGWFMPLIINKQLFEELGSYPTFPPFPEPNDIKFFKQLQKELNVQYFKIKHPIYHFQRLSQRV